MREQERRIRAAVLRDAERLLRQRHAAEQLSGAVGQHRTLCRLFILRQAAAAQIKDYQWQICMKKKVFFN